MDDGFENVLLKQAERYPGMQIADVVKLAYQNAMGNGHMITDEDESLLRMRAECQAAAPQHGAALFEPIGGGLCRMNLAALCDTALSLETAHRFFVLSTGLHAPSQARLEENLAALQQVCQTGRLSFFREALVDALSRYRAQGYPAVSHSEVYRGRYRPAYRVVHEAFCDFFLLFEACDRLLAQKDFVVIAIDGNSGAGKSSLGRLFAAVYRANLLHTDDFFLQPSQRTAERLREPGGNLDVERFLSQVVPGLRRGAPFSYQKFDCAINRLTPEIPVSPSRLTVVEGCYSLHPAFADVYDLKVFLSVSPKEQRERILQRNGAALCARFLSEWIPLENRYFQAFGIQDACDFVFDRTGRPPIPAAG